MIIFDIFIAHKMLSFEAHIRSHGIVFIILRQDKIMGIEFIVADHNHWCLGGRNMIFTLGIFAKLAVFHHATTHS